LRFNFHLALGGEEFHAELVGKEADFIQGAGEKALTGADRGMAFRGEGRVFAAMEMDYPPTKMVQTGSA